MLIGFATLMYALQQQVPRSNREADRQDKAIKALTQIIEKDLAKTVYSEEIFIDILHSRTLGDVAYDRLVSLFQLLGVNDETQVSTYIPSFLAWSREEVEYFRHELPGAGKNASMPKNCEFNLVTKATPKSPPKKPPKKLGRNKSETQASAAP